MDNNLVALGIFEFSKNCGLFLTICNCHCLRQAWGSALEQNKLFSNCVFCLFQFLDIINPTSSLWYTWELVLWWNFTKLLLPVSLRYVYNSVKFTWGPSHGESRNPWICRVVFCPWRKGQFHESLSNVAPDVNLFSTVLLLCSLHANQIPWQN